MIHTWHQAQPHTTIEWSRTVRAGAGLTIITALTYAGIFVGYSVMRSSVAIIRTLPPDISLAGTLIANAAAIIVPSFVTALLAGLLLMPLGIANAMLVQGLLTIFNNTHNSQRALAIGLVAAIFMIVMMQALVSALIGQPVFALGVETYLFWLGLPALFHIMTSTGAAWYLNQLIGK